MLPTQATLKLQYFLFSLTHQICMSEGVGGRGSKGRAAVRRHSRLKASHADSVSQQTLPETGLCSVPVPWLWLPPVRCLVAGFHATVWHYISLTPADRKRQSEDTVFPPRLARSSLPVINVNNAAQSEGDRKSGGPCPKCCDSLMTCVVSSCVKPVLANARASRGLHTWAV